MEREKYETNLPYESETRDGETQINESKNAVYQWMLDAANRYSADVPQAVLEEIQSHYLREEDCVITMEEAARKVTSDMIEKYIAAELNFRLKDFDPEMKANETERILEKLNKPLSDDEARKVGANYKMAGEEYANAIASHFILDHSNVKACEKTERKAAEEAPDMQEHDQVAGRNGQKERRR